MNIKSLIKSSFVGEMLVEKLHEIEGLILPKIISDEKAIKKHYKNGTGKELNLDNPITFCEKLNWYKINVRNPLMVKCADKIGVREYVTEKGYGENVNKVYGIYTDVNDIDLSKLPARFVIKAAHGTHMQIIVKDKNEINWKKAKMLMKSWLKQDIYWRGREWSYKEVPHRIIIEEYLEDESGELRDYKVFCFNGVPRFIQVDVGRYNATHNRNYYDTNWNLLSMTDDVPNNPNLNIEKPKSFEKMLEMSTKLSEPLQFVRVDFYEVNGKPYLGEMTFFHNGGSVEFIPDEWNKIVGDYWTLVK